VGRYIHFMEENKEVTEKPVEGKKPWVKHWVNPATGDLITAPVDLISDWRAPGFYYPGISRMELLAGMIASGAITGSGALPTGDYIKTHARAVVALAVELAKALDEAGAE
jgi:hypothetical protein